MFSQFFWKYFSIDKKTQADCSWYARNAKHGWNDGRYGRYDGSHELNEGNVWWK